jgi:hypothetical protein
MTRLLGIALGALLMVASRSEATITLELRVDADVRTEVAVHVAVKNVGEEDAADVLPEVTLAGASAKGDAPTALAAGYVAAWDLTLPRPSALGTLPLVVQLRYADATGHRMSAPAVHVVRTAGTPAANVAIAMDARFETIERGGGTVRITNHETAPASGTLTLVGNEELLLTPRERAIEVPPGSTVALPFEIGNRGALPDSAVALWASLALARGASVETVVASAVIPVTVAVAAPERPWGLVAVGAVALLALVAWRLRRAVAPSDGPRTRAHRRRARRSP